jgi:hypothetical protein
MERAATGVGFEAFQSIEYEPGFEKVAIYVDADQIVTHMARKRSMENGQAN